MVAVTFKGQTVHTFGDLPKVGSHAPDFTLVTTDMQSASLATFAGKKKVLNIFPSLDTGVCATSVRQFHKRASSISGTVVLNISLDLPYAHKRFCTAEGIEGVANLSGFRDPSFGSDYGVRFTDGKMIGLYSRAVVVLDEHNKVLHAEQVPEITQEPDYEAALAKLA